MTVTGTARPSVPYTCVIPTLRPMIPSIAMVSYLLRVLFTESLDLDVDAGGQIQLHQGVDGLRRRLEDVEQPLVRADLELLAALLVDVGRPVDRPGVLHSRQRDRPR